MLPQSVDACAYVSKLARAIVLQTAPEELELFDELIVEYHAAPHDHASAHAPDDPLGFGAGELVIAMTSVAAAMANAALSYVGTELLKLTGDQVIKQVKQRATRLFGSDGAPPALRPEQLEQVRLRAYEEALTFGVEQAVAEQMARALIGSLALTER